ncbi:type III secretion protein D [Hydrogenophaga palleronii]|uniref:Type III secretion protein D n=1 Tax=Hydrogenophaga palleronii TaxID=65655 RepID=A0ABU1WL00_9BURK|nr:type III secretion protein D [Hydrogenophaga palleronii]
MTASKYRIAADEQADIQLVDWQVQPLELELLEEGNVLTITLNQADMADRSARPFADFEPRRFGDVVLCAGPVGVAWPSDMELLECLMRPIAKAAHEVRDAAASSWTRMASAVAAVAALAAGGAFGAVTWQGTLTQKADAVTEPLVNQVSRLLSDAGWHDLEVRTSAERVVVEGLLTNSAEVLTLRQQLARFPSESIEHRYAAASEIAQSISDALSTSGLVASYRGRGVFEVSGRAMYLDEVRAAANRIAADLAPLVRGIEVVASEAPAPDTVPVGAMLSTDGLKYVQTRDGAKHLSLAPEPIGNR